MNTAYLRIIKLAGKDIGQLLGKSVEIDKETAVYSCWGKDGTIQVIVTEGSGNSFKQRRFAFNDEVMLQYVKNAYGIPDTISCNVRVLPDGSEITFTYLLKEPFDTPTPIRESAAPAKPAEADEGAKAGSRGGRAKGTGKKLPVLPGNLRPGQ